MLGMFLDMQRRKDAQSRYEEARGHYEGTHALLRAAENNACVAKECISLGIEHVHLWGISSGTVHIRQAMLCTKIKHF